MCALEGMGGIGKSALAIHVAHRVADRFPDGQLVVDMRGTSDRSLSTAEAMGKVIQSLEPATQLPDGEEQRRELFHSTLHGLRVLIIADDARDSAQVRPLQPSSPSALIITSRQRIAVSERLDLEVLPASEAINLLMEIIGVDRCGEAEFESLAENCGRLPLALRVAGSHLALNPEWPVAEYIEELGDEERRLETLRASGSSEWDVEVILSHSARLLTEEDPALALHWQRLSVFPSGFKRSAAAAVWEMGETNSQQHLSGLASRSLLRFDGESGRYSMHDLLRPIAREVQRYRASPEPVDGANLAAARQHHAEHYLNVLGDADRLYLMGEEGVIDGLELLDGEWDNIEAGQRCAAEQFGVEKWAALAAMRYPDAGAYVLSLRLHPTENVRWLERAVQAAREIGDRRGEGNALGNLGSAYLRLGQVEKAIEYHEQALVIVREIGDRRGEGNALGNLGTAYARLGQVEKAIEFYEQQLVIVREIGDRRGEGNALGNLGLAYARLGQVEKAIEYHEQALVIVREIGDRRGEGNALGNLGLAYLRLGQVEKAIELHEQALVIVREIGDRRGEGADLGNLGTAYARLGQVEKAIEYHEQALVIGEEVKDPLIIEVTMQGLKKLRG